MSDPIEQLNHFGDSFEGGPMQHHSAHAARQRGDRIRRRRTALVAAGSAAAVVAVAVPVLALAGGTGGPKEVPPATEAPSTAPLTTDNLLADADTRADGFGTTWQTSETYPGDGQATYHPCADTSLSGLGATDIENRTWTLAATGDKAIDRLNTQAWMQQAVAEFPTAQDALSAYQEIAGTQRDCEQLQGIYGDYEFQSGATADVPIPAVGQAQYFAASYDNVQDPQGGGYTHVLETGLVVSGNRISVLGMSYGGQDYLPEEMNAMIPVSATRLVTGTSGDGTPPPSTTTDDTTPDATGLSVIPDDFPLAAGWPDDSTAEGEDMGLEGPSRSLDALTFEACGTGYEDPEYADRLGASWTNPEDFRNRQLTTYASADEAVAAVESLVAVYQDCPVGPVRDDGYRTHYEVSPLDVGGQSYAIRDWDTLDGNESPYGGVTLVVRVGLGVLVSTQAGEGGRADQSVIDAMLTEADAPIAEMFCDFSEAGCGDGQPDPGGEQPALGPDGYGDLVLGMSGDDAEATGQLELASANGNGCTGFSLTGFPARKGLTDGYVSSANGLELIFARPGMQTPEGIGLGSSADDVAAAYPGTDASAALVTVPLDNAEYVISLREGTVTELALALQGQTCWD